MRSPTPAEALRQLPGGLTARPVTTEDLAAVTQLIRDVDLAASGTTSTNEQECADMLGEPECRWGQGAAVVERGGELVGVLVTFDGVESGRGWSYDAYVQPGDPVETDLVDRLVRTGLSIGQQRWAEPATAGQVDVVGLVAKVACYPTETGLRAVLAALGFVEDRRFWRMIIEHGVARRDEAPPGGAGVAGAATGAPAVDRPSMRIRLPDGYSLRAVRADDEEDLHRLFVIANTCFADHYDFTAQPFDQWLAVLSGETEDPDQWLFVERDGLPAGYVRGSDRFASEGLGYVASLGVLREHRGRGLAKALLRARFADDITRGRVGTLLHVDASNPTGALRVYESAGMRVDQEYVFHRRPLLD